LGGFEVTVTLNQLRENGAGKSQLILFEKTFGEKVVLTKEVLLESASKFDLYWLASEMLTDEALVVYNEALVSAWKVYVEAATPAWKVHNEAADPNWKVFDEATAPAWKVFDEARAVALWEVLR